MRCAGDVRDERVADMNYSAAQLRPLRPCGEPSLQPKDYDDRAEQYAERIYAERSQDLEHLSDAMDWVLYRKCGRNHPCAIDALKLIRDGNDDAELGRLIRETTLAALKDSCDDAGQEEADAELDAAREASE
jgi:hypothetical protein